MSLKNCHWEGILCSRTSFMPSQNIRPHFGQWISEAAEKKGSTNGSSAEAEGEGWETASEGDESHAVNDGDSLNGKAATTTGASSEEHFEDAMTEEEQRLVILAWNSFNCECLLLLK